MRAEEGPHRFSMKENHKLPGNKNVRNNRTGRFDAEAKAFNSNVKHEITVETDKQCKCNQLEYAAKVIDSHLKAAKKAEDFDVAEHFFDCVKVITEAFQEINTAKRQ